MSLRSWILNRLVDALQQPPAAPAKSLHIGGEHNKPRSISVEPKYEYDDPPDSDGTPPEPSSPWPSAPPSPEVMRAYLAGLPPAPPPGPPPPPRIVTPSARSWQTVARGRGMGETAVTIDVESPRLLIDLRALTSDGALVKFKVEPVIPQFFDEKMQAGCTMRLPADHGVDYELTFVWEPVEGQQLEDERLAHAARMGLPPPKPQVEEVGRGEKGGGQ